MGSSRVAWTSDRRLVGFIVVLETGSSGFRVLLVVLSQGSMAFWIFEASGSVRFGEACCGSRRSLNPRR